jgi:hypothetical protein
MLDGYTKKPDAPESAWCSKAWCAEAMGWCYQCNQFCPMQPIIAEGTLWIEVGGNTCTPWSSSGARLGWLDPSSVPALAWGWWISQCRPQIIINECVPAWPAEEFWEAMLCRTNFSQETIKMNPKDMGIPCSRPRSYTIVACQPSVQLTAVSQALKESCTRSMVIDAAVYFKATPDMQLQLKRAILERRHIQLTSDELAMFPWSRCLSFGARSRLTDHKRMLNKKMEQSGQVQDKRAMLAMVSQTMSFAGPVRSLVPTLLRNSMCFIISEQRLMLPIEHFLVNGVPLFYENLPPKLQVIPVQAFETLGESEARRLAGNMMHLASVGSILLGALCCYCHNVLPTPESPLGLELEDGDYGSEGSESDSDDPMVPVPSLRRDHHGDLICDPLRHGPEVQRREGHAPRRIPIETREVEPEPEAVFSVRWLPQPSVEELYLFGATED